MENTISLVFFFILFMEHVIFHFGSFIFYHNSRVFAAQQQRKRHFIYSPRLMLNENCRSVG